MQSSVAFKGKENIIQNSLSSLFQILQGFNILTWSGKKKLSRVVKRVTLVGINQADLAELCKCCHMEITFSN